MTLGLTDREKNRLRQVARAILLAKPSHATKIEFVNAVVRVEFRDGNVTKIEAGAWK